MRPSTFFLLIISTFLFCSCSDFTDEQPPLPEDVEIDLDDDGTVDYVIDFAFVDIDPGPGSDIGFFGMGGRINPRNLNQILRKTEDRNLFLRNLEDIKDTVEEPLRWSVSGFSRQIMSLNTNMEGQWPNKWELNTDESHSTYFIGLKLINNNSTQIGWVELDINRSNGIVEIIDKGLI